MKKFLKYFYDVIITLLAIFSVVLVLFDFSSIVDLSVMPWEMVDHIIWGIFTIDYVSRFIISKEKKTFFKENIFDLIAILPFNEVLSIFRISRLFRVARLARLSRLTKGLRLFRTFGFLGVLKKRLDNFLHTNGFIYVLYSAGALILTSSIAMSYLENKSFGDALWWSIVTTTTVGYGDISPVTPIGRIIAVILMIFGIGLIGMLTGTITTYFTSNREPLKNTDNDCTALLEIAQTLDDEQLKELTAIAKTLKDINK
ncbi:MAG TPA: potassium channel family protein [Caproiciproducens sp.]|nr:potassium channel family protein [Caproiciproducens sp.]